MSSDVLITPLGSYLCLGVDQMPQDLPKKQTGGNYATKV